MTTINRFDKENLDPVLDDVMAELRKVGEKYGLDFGRKSCTYGSGDFRMTIFAKVRDRAEGVLTKEERDYDLNARLHGLPERGFEYFSNGITMTVVGWNNRARKYPVKIQGSDGKSYKTSIMSVKSHMSR